MQICAVADACQQLNVRLAPFRARLPGAAFKDVVSAAYLERVDLSAHGFHATPNITGAAPALSSAQLQARTTCCLLRAHGHGDAQRSRLAVVCQCVLARAGSTPFASSL